MIWATHRYEKVPPDAPARASSDPIAVKAGRNGFAAFQLVIRGDARDVVPSVTIDGIPQENIHLFREEYLDLTRQSGPDGWKGRTPDGLAPMGKDDVVGEERKHSLDVPSNECRTVWVDVHVPPDARPGTYKGVAKVKASNGSEESLPVLLTVWSFAVPSTAVRRSYWSFTYGAIPAAHGVKGDFSRLRLLYTQLGLDHFMSVSWFDDGDKDANHIAQAYGAAMNGTLPTQLRGARLTTLNRIGDKAAFAKMAKANGWDRIAIDYGTEIDEPPSQRPWTHIPVYAESSRAAGLPVVCTTNMDRAAQNGVVGAIDIFCPLINHMNDKPESMGGWERSLVGGQGDKYKEWLEGDPHRELWLYQSCMSHGCGGEHREAYWAGWPSYAVDADPVRCVALHWLMWEFRAKGELYYETAQMLAQAWTDQWVEAFGGNGDGTLFCPGTPERIGGRTPIPCATIRMKLIRDGYQTLALLDQLAARDEGLVWSFAMKLFPNPYTYPKATDLLDALDRLGTALDEANRGKDPGTPPVEPPPAPRPSPTTLEERVAELERRVSALERKA